MWFPSCQVICGGGLLLTVEHVSATCSSLFCVLMMEASRVDLRGVARKKRVFCAELAGLRISGSPGPAHAGVTVGLG